MKWLVIIVIMCAVAAAIGIRVLRKGQEPDIPHGSHRRGDSTVPPTSPPVTSPPPSGMRTEPAMPQEERPARAADQPAGSDFASEPEIPGDTGTAGDSDVPPGDPRP
jgi:hypothetical protein